MITIIDQIHQLVPTFRKILKTPTLELCLAPEWGSNHKDSRILLRKAMVVELGKMYDKYNQFSSSDREILLCLESVPQPHGASVSISHTLSLGGFALARAQEPALGFDIELASRLRPTSVERVSDSGELEKAPGISHIWVAKEAAFKSMRGSKQPAVISMVKTSAWRSVMTPENFSLWTCEIDENSISSGSTRGLTVELSGIALSIFVHQP